MFQFCEEIFNSSIIDLRETLCQMFVNIDNKSTMYHDNYRIRFIQKKLKVYNRCVNPESV